MSTSFIPAHDPRSRLDRRSKDLATAAESVADVIVIGGGITGTGVALDAATRGLDVVLIEGHDLAFGTSRWSSKLAHGGLRYLAHGQVDVAWESAVERAHLVNTIAPHLIHPYAQLVPIFSDTSAASALLTRAGLEAGDVMRKLARTKHGALGNAHWVKASKVQRAFPSIRNEDLRGAALSWDARLIDDARLVTAVARTAAAYGAKVITHAMAEAVTSTSVTIRDEFTQETATIRAANVINATGVWAHQLDHSINLRPSRGTHLLIRAATLRYPRAALTVPVPHEKGRYCFLIPIDDGLVLAGITDVEVHEPIPDVPEPSQDEINEILTNASIGLEVPLTQADVVGTFAGLRPLIAPTEHEHHDGTATLKSSDLSRKHFVVRNDDGVITVTGGKLTTYRRMAEDAVNLITDRACHTTNIPLVGAGPVPNNPDIPERLIRRYGNEAAVVASLASKDHSLLEPLHPHVPTLGVEIVFAIQAEGALTFDDITARRTRLSLVPEDLAKATPRIHEILTQVGFSA